MDTLKGEAGILAMHSSGQTPVQSLRPVSHAWGQTGSSGSLPNHIPLHAQPLSTCKLQQDRAEKSSQSYK